MFFTAHNKGIVTKLAEKMGREYIAGQLFCNAHTALVLLCLTFKLFNLVYNSWLRLVIDYFYCIRAFIIRHAWKLHKKIIEKQLWWSLFRPVVLLKKGSYKGVLQWILQNVEKHLFSKTSAHGCFWTSLMQ